MFKHILSGSTNEWKLIIFNSLIKNNSIFIITGSKEKYLETASKYKDILPSIEITSIDKTSYLPQLEDPSGILEQINIYLDDLTEE